MRRAKIVCTIGPSSSSRRILERMVRAGMNVARLNFSHGSHEEHARAFKNIRAVSRRQKVPVAVLQDLKGLKIRVGALRDGAVVLKKNTTVTLTVQNRTGDAGVIPVTYSRLVQDVKKGDVILMDDGLIRLRVTDKGRGRLTARVVEGGFLREKKGVNLPGVRISGATFTEKDKKDLEFGVKTGVDIVALSFVRSESDIVRVKKWLKKLKAGTPVIAKIERPQALENIDGIIRSADGLMVARGDLGVEVSPEKVPLIQKELIKRCNEAMKPIITATQMLESMTGHMSPTRAEAADVANAVLDGTDALMLSAETSIGKYPVESIGMMDRIIRHTETNLPAIPPFEEIVSSTFAQAIAESACVSAMDIQAEAIAAFSRTGFTALLVSNLPPRVQIVGFTASEDVQRRMSLYWGVNPHIMKFPGSIDDMIVTSEKALLKKGFVKKGDAIVIIATSPFAPGGKTNIMKIHKVGY
jgi:pyruvate kinase